MIKILVIHGPNMNLLGIRSYKNGTNITLNKINTVIKKLSKNNNIKLKCVLKLNYLLV